MLLFDTHSKFKSAHIIALSCELGTGAILYRIFYQLWLLNICSAIQTRICTYVTNMTAFTV